MSLLELWKVLSSELLIIIAREGVARDILFSGISSEIPEKLLSMNVCYVDLEESEEDNSYFLYVSVEELKGENNA